MRKIIVAVGGLALLVLGSPSVDAKHGPEGTVTVRGKESCSTKGDKPDGRCTWTATDPGGWAGFGPFTITWTTAAGTETFTCAAGKYCSSSGKKKDPIPVGAKVTSDGKGGGTFAAGDADQHNKK